MDIPEPVWASIPPATSDAVLPAQPSLFITDMPSPGGQEDERTQGESPQTTAPFTVTNKLAPVSLSS